MVSFSEELTEREISEKIRTKCFGRNLIFHEVTGSTNADAAEAAEAGAPEGTLVVTERQKAGKGRRGRSWVSPEKCNLYFSLLLRPVCKPEQACMVTLVMALAVAEAVKESGLDAKIKWPNDIVLSGKKVCGILTEMSLGSDGIRHVVIGTGINVNQETFAEEICRTATSLKLEKGKVIDRARLLARVMEQFERFYQIFSESWDLSGLIQAYEEMLVNKNAHVRVLDPKGEFEGISRGINELGELLVEREDGQIENVYAGEVSVRGIYGYV